MEEEKKEKKVVSGPEIRKSHLSALATQHFFRQPVNGAGRPVGQQRDNAALMESGEKYDEQDIVAV